MNRIPLKPLTLIALVIGSMTTFAQQPPDRKPRVVITLVDARVEPDGGLAIRGDAGKETLGLGTYDRTVP